MALITLSNELGFIAVLLQKDRAPGLLTAPNPLEGLLQLALSQLHLRQRTQIIVTGQRDEASGVMCRHLKVTHEQQAASTSTVLNPLDTKDIKRVGGAFTRHHIGSQGLPKGPEPPASL
jgi:hypothetical protein